MSTYGLIKETSRIQRADTITDLVRLNSWLSKKGTNPILSYGQSVRALENTVALGLDRNYDLGLDRISDLDDIPKLVRGKSFYKSILPEIKDIERKKWTAKNTQK